MTEIEDLTKIFHIFFTSDKRRHIAFDICLYLKTKKIKAEFAEFKKALVIRYKCRMENIVQVIGILRKNGWIEYKKPFYSLNFNAAEIFSHNFNEFIQKLVAETTPVGTAS